MPTPAGIRVYGNFSHKFNGKCNGNARECLVVCPLVNTLRNGVYVNHNNQAVEFFVLRDLKDRRVATHCQPPYLAEEGLVLIDRREAYQRRKEAHDSPMSTS